MKQLLATAAILLSSMAAANADSGIRRVPCGYQQLAVDTAKSLTIPAACGEAPSLAVIRTEAQAVRYRDDGTAPTTTVGMPIAIADPPLEYQGRISALQFIAQTSGGIVDVLFYK